MTVLELARRYLARGFSVFPVPRPRPGTPPNTPGDGKTPALRWGAYQTRRPTPYELAGWFATPMNLALVTGAISDVVVVDADSPEALNWVATHLPETPWQTETAKGWHFFYQHPGGHVTTCVKPKTDAGELPIDIRADGGYVMAPGSIHATGVVYRFAGDWRLERDQLPRFDPAWIPRRTPERVASHLTPLSSSRDVITRARAYLARVPKPDIGHNSDMATFIAAARLVRGFALAPADAEELLWEWCGNRPGWSRDWVARKVTHAARREHGETIGGYLR